MKKSILASMIMASCAANAGTMGPVAVAPLMGFVSAEGGYTWNKIKNPSFNLVGGDLVTPFAIGLNSTKKNQGGTARIAVGALHPINDLLFLSGEIGWGYYGKTTTRVGLACVGVDCGGTDLSGLRLTQTLWGFDVLAGVVYNQPMFDLFFKAGALIQNAQHKLNTGSLAVITDGAIAGNVNIRTNTTQALPEIKVGASYHVWDNLSVFAAYTHAFGTSSKPLGFALDLTAPATYLTVNRQNPSMDVVTGGLTYRFA